MKKVIVALSLLAALDAVACEGLQGMSYVTCTGNRYQNNQDMLYRDKQQSIYKHPVTINPAVSYDRRMMQMPTPDQSFEQIIIQPMDD